MDQINCHYVSRFLTKEWEKNGWLSYFDFETLSIQRGFSKNLFASPGTNSLDFEVLFNKYVESPLSRFKRKYLTNSIQEVGDWSVYRALFLYFAFQAKRFLKSKLQVDEPEAQKSIEQFFQKDEKFFNSLVLAFSQSSNIVRFNMPQGNVLHFPEAGFFQFPIDDPKTISGYSFATAVPLTPFVALAMVSKTADLKKFREFHGLLECFSVGLNNNSRRVLVSSILFECNEVKEIERILPEHREGSRTQIRLIFEKEALMQEMANLYFDN